MDVELYGDLVAGHTERMEAKGIMIEWTIADGPDPHFGDPAKALDFFIERKYPNVWVEAENEFYDYYFTVQRAVDLVNKGEDAGLIMSCGAWGYSAYGQDYAREFDERQKRHRVRVMHRDYQDIPMLESNLGDLQDGRPTAWNEALRNPPVPSGIPIAELGNYVDAAFNAGARAVCTYGDEWELMGKICKEKNPS